jgi:hypothetical protein
MKRLDKKLQWLLDQMQPGKWHRPEDLGRLTEAKLERLRAKGLVAVNDEGRYRLL